MDRKKQVLEILKEYTESDEWKWSAPQIGRDSCLDCIEALEKQIPKELKKQGYFKVCECGCEMSTFLMYNRANYCPNCGQAIKWE